MKRIILGLAALGCVAGSGCFSTKVFTYPDGKVMPVTADFAPFAGKKVAVENFVENFSRANSTGGFALILVPLFPYGEVNLGNPAMSDDFITIKQFYFLPSRDLATAAAESLKRSGMFGEVVSASGTAAGDADYRFSGDIRSLDYRGRIFTYGIPIVGPVLSILGAPFGTSRDRLALTLRLKDRDGNIVWQKQYDEEDSTIQGLYYHWGRDAAMYAELMAKIMNDAVGELQQQ